MSPLTEQALHRYLSETTGRAIQLRLNRNTHQLVSTRHDRKAGVLRLSVHRSFLQAPEDVLRALAEFAVRPNRENRRAIREFVAARNEVDPSSSMPARRPVNGSPKGVCTDLEPIAKRLNKTHFGGKLDFRIIWGRRPKSRPRRMRHITLGLCMAERKLIRIHPILDSPFVPSYYLEYIIYHEMAHLAVPSRCGADGRMHHHTAEFYEIERAYPQYRAAIAWQKANLGKLLTRWCRPSKVPLLREVQLTLFPQ